MKLFALWSWFITQLFWNAPCFILWELSQTLHIFQDSFQMLLLHDTINNSFSLLNSSSLWFHLYHWASPEKEMAAHSGTLAWKIPWMEEPVGYSPWGRKDSDMTEWLHFLSFYSSFWRGKWQPTPVFLPGESHGWRDLVGYSLWGCKESDID